MYTIMANDTSDTNQMQNILHIYIHVQNSLDYIKILYVMYT